MQYKITVDEITLTVTFEGVLTAVDLIFMNQDVKYRQGLQGKKNLLLDFSQISGSQLSPEDVSGLAMLGKLDSKKVSNINLIILVAKGHSKGMQMMCESIFSDSSWSVSVFDSRDAVLNTLKA